MYVKKNILSRRMDVWAGCNRKTDYIGLARAAFTGSSGQSCIFVIRAKELVCRLRDTDPILKSTGTSPEFNKVLHEGNVQMYRKGISKLLIAGLLLSGIQLPGTTGIAQADSGRTQQGCLQVQDR